jgi:SET domain-containing protein
VALFKGDKKERYHTTKFGSYINHSYTPNAVTKKEGDKYITYAYDNIESGDEITVDYKVNPELEQPDSSWK